MALPTAAEKYIRQQLRNTSLHLSILGVGTDKGAPIATANGGFAKDRNGNIVLPKLEREPLIKLAQLSGGQYTDLTPDNRDLKILESAFAPTQTQQSKQLERSFDHWHDQGYLLVLLLIPLVILSFRKGLVACMLLAPLLSSLIVEPVQAAEDKPQPEVNRLPEFLQSKDQQGQNAFQSQQYEKASKVFQDSNWKGSAAYRNGDFETALREFQKDDSATGLYNQGNALAQLGELDKAIESYTKALEQDPSLTDAAANKKAVGNLKKQQQQENQQGDNQQNSQDQQSGQDSQPNESQDSEQQQSDEQNSDQKESDQQSSDQQNQEAENSKEKSDKPQDGEESQNEQQPEGEPQNTESSDAAKEEAEQAMEQYLRKVPDNPGAFLREKFRRQQQQQRQHQKQPERW